MKQKFIPLSGMNSQGALSTVSPAQYTAAFNVNIADPQEGKLGSVTNKVGNVKTTIPYFETEALNPLAAISDGNPFFQITRINGVDLDTPLTNWEEFWFNENTIKRVVGTYEDAARDRLYYFIAFEQNQVVGTDDDTLSEKFWLGDPFLALVVFEKYEILDDYYILLENGSIVLTEDGDFLINENSVNGDILGDTYVVGLWQYYGNKFEWGSRWNITGIGMIGNELFWSMGEKDQPMFVNVERGIFTFQPAYDSIYEIDPVPYDLVRTTTGNPYALETYMDFIDQKVSYQIKRGGLFPMSTGVRSEAGAVILGDKVMQFSFRYIYENGYESVLAPFTEKILYLNPNGDPYNVIDLKFPDIEVVPRDVKRVEFCYREGNFDADGVWVSFKSVPIDELNLTVFRYSQYTFTYRGNRTGLVIPTDQAIRTFDAVPLQANALEVASNRVFLGNVIPAGSYDIDVNDLNFTIQVNSGDGEAVYGSYQAYEVAGEFEDFSGSGVASSSPVYYVLIIVNNSPDTSYNGIYSFSESGSVADINLFGTGNLPTQVDLDTPVVSWTGSALSSSEVSGQIEQYLTPDTPPTPPSGFPVFNGMIINSYGTYSGGQVLMDAFTTNSSLFSQYKTGTSYQFGIVPYDSEGRTCGVLTNDDMIIDIPFRSYGNATSNAIVTFEISVDANFPEWAETYSIVRTKNLTISDYVQFGGVITNGKPSIIYARGNNIDGIPTYELLDNDTGSEYVAISIEGLLSSGGGWLKSEDNTVIIIDHLSNVYKTKVLDLYQDEDGNTWYICSWINANFISSTTNPQPIYEFRRNKDISEENNLFYETGYFSFARRVTGSKIFNIKGDTYIKNRNSFFVEHYTVDYKKKHPVDYVIGRPLIPVFSNKQKTIGDRIVFSGTAIIDADVTYVNSFSGLHYKEVSDRSGNIQKLIMTSREEIYGQVMLAIGRTGTSSLYLGESLLKDSSGSVMVTASSEVIGSINELRGGFGTSHPCSVAAYQGTVCWYDVNKGSVVRYNSNGINEISLNGMADYFTVMADFVKPLKLAASISKRHNEYCIHIGVDSNRPDRLLQGYDTDVVNPFELSDGYVIRYSLVNDIWISADTYEPSELDNIGTLEARFNGGRLWIHKSASRNNFFGESYASSVALVLNTNPNTVKVIEAISVESDEKPSHVYIQNLRPYIQQSDLVSNDFRTREGVHYADVLRDRLTPNLIPDYNLGLNIGERIRGQYINVSVEYDYPDEDFELNAINIKYVESTGHNTLN